MGSLDLILDCLESSCLISRLRVNEGRVYHPNDLGERQRIARAKVQPLPSSFLEEMQFYFSKSVLKVRYELMKCKFEEVRLLYRNIKF